MSSIGSELQKFWPLIKWLDDARWEAQASDSPIAGPAFRSLAPHAQILVHWLCYITDQRRPWESVWNQGGPVFSELVYRYTTVQSLDDLLDLLVQSTTPNRPSNADWLATDTFTFSSATESQALCDIVLALGFTWCLSRGRWPC